MKKINKYDIDEQFLNEAWAKMSKQLDSELPLQKPWYIGKMWYVVGLAASLLLFTSYYCLNVENTNIIIANNKVDQYEISNSNANKNELSNQQNFEKTLTEIDNDNKTNVVITNKEEVLAKAINATNNNNSLKNNKIEQLVQAKVAVNNSTSQNSSNPIKKSVDLTANSALSSKFISSTTSLPFSKANNISSELPSTSIIPNTSSGITSTTKIIETSTSKNENIPSLNDELLSNNTFQNLSIAKNTTVEKTNNTIELLPLMKSALSNNDFEYELATLITDTPNSKIWQTKKPISFGLTLGVNTNVKDASSIRAGLFANYKFTDKLMLGASVAYSYAAINTNYDVQYNVPVDPQELTTTTTLDDPMERSVKDEISYNTNYKGINTKLMLSYFPIKRLSIVGGLFATRYFLSNTDFDFLESNIVYNSRNLDTNYGYNKYQAGPAFELQYWVKPKLNVAATFEMNLIPEVKQEFWATANKQDYLRNNFGVALQYQFN